MTGLDALNKQRERARQSSSRSVPPPRHPARTQAMPAPAAPPAAASPVTAAEQPAPTAARPAPARSATVVLDELTRSSIYLDAAADAFLEHVRSAGRAGKPKVDASRSAVVRLALARLESDMNAGQIVGELRRRAGLSDQTTGRKRL